MGLRGKFRFSGRYSKEGIPIDEFVPERSNRLRRVGGAIAGAAVGAARGAGGWTRRQVEAELERRRIYGDAYREERKRALAVRAQLDARRRTIYGQPRTLGDVGRGLIFGEFRAPPVRMPMRARRKRHGRRGDGSRVIIVRGG